MVNLDHGPFNEYLLVRQPGDPRGIRGFPSSDYSEFGFVVEYIQNACFVMSKSSAETKEYLHLSDITRFFKK
jgi:hypothetical protein